MPGASSQTQRVKIRNANWTPDNGGDGRFEVVIVTHDDEHHVAPASPAMTALVALARADTVLAWDPTNHALIAANRRGTMPWTQEH